MQKERPILYSTPMVQALLDDSKTMTRRTKGLEEINDNPDDWQFEWASFDLKKPWRFTKKSSVNKKSLAERNFIQAECKCPYGNIGDILWVKETTRQYYPVDGDGYMNMEKLIVEYVADGGLEPLLLSDGDGGFELDKNGQEKCVPLTPSLFMKKEHCRIRLEITNIRVQRLHDISEEDAKNEGAYRGILRDGPNTEKGQFHLEFNVHGYYKTGFEFIWKVINGKESWNANPWVWVISFKKL